MLSMRCMVLTRHVSFALPAMSTSNECSEHKTNLKVNITRLSKTNKLLHGRESTMYKVQRKWHGINKKCDTNIISVINLFIKISSTLFFIHEAFYYSL